MRVASAVLALAYTLAFFAVCFGTCLGNATADQHTCCKQGEGFTTADTTFNDCCAVMSGVCNNVTTGLATTADVVARVPPLAASPSAVPLVRSPVPVASSPPLVLRI